MQNVTVNDDINVLSADRYGLRVVITNLDALIAEARLKVDEVIAKR